MAEPTTDAQPPVFRCQWCSAPLPAGDLETCPSCGATLTSSPLADQLPGVTTLDTEAILRARSAVARPRSRLLSFITGETDEGTAEAAASAESLAPPSADVRREMLRLELAAEVADLEAEVQSLETEARLEAGVPLTPEEAAAAEAEVHAGTAADTTTAAAAPAAGSTTAATDTTPAADAAAAPAAADAEPAAVPVDPAARTDAAADEERSV